MHGKPIFPDYSAISKIDTLMAKLNKDTIKRLFWGTEVMRSQGPGKSRKTQFGKPTSQLNGKEVKKVVAPFEENRETQ